MIRGFLDGPFGSCVRDALFRAEVRREAVFVREQSQFAGIKTHAQKSFLHMLESRNKETFFILGSGSSVEDNSRLKFEVIREGVSVGVNAWVLHDFIPSFYAYEPVPVRDSDHYRTLGILNRPDVLSAEPYVLVLRPRTPVEFEQLGQIPQELFPKTVLYGRVAMSTRRKELLQRDVDFSLTHLSQQTSPLVTMDSGATIVRMTSLALQLGYQRIVYVGVDLNHAEYFWEVNPAYLKRRGIESFSSGQSGTQHETLNPARRPFVVTEVIEKLFEGFATRNRVQMFSGSETSELAKFLPLFPWGDRLPRIPK